MIRQEWPDHRPAKLFHSCLASPPTRPLFLGIGIGHFLVAGRVWGLFSMFSDQARRYVVWFT